MPKQEFDVTEIIIEVDNLRRKVRLLERTIARWAAPTGVHRSCDCQFCEALRDLVEPAEVKEK